MAYCEEKAIPYSKWISEWSPVDRARILAVRLEKAERCQRCGTAPWEWDANPLAYEPIEVQCPGCQKLEAGRDPARPLAAGSQLVLMAAAVVRKMRETPKRTPRRRG